MVPRTGEKWKSPYQRLVNRVVWKGGSGMACDINLSFVYKHWPPFSIGSLERHKIDNWIGANFAFKNIYTLCYEEYQELIILGGFGTINSTVILDNLIEFVIRDKFLYFFAVKSTHTFANHGWQNLQLWRCKRKVYSKIFGEQWYRPPLHPNHCKEKYKIK